MMLHYRAFKLPPKLRTGDGAGRLVAVHHPARAVTSSDPGRLVRRPNGYGV